MTNSDLYEYKMQDKDTASLEYSDSDSNDGDDGQGKKEVLDPIGKCTNPPQPLFEEAGAADDNDAGPIDEASDRDETGDVQEVGSSNRDESQGLQQANDNNPGDTITVQLPESPRRQAEDVLKRGQQKLEVAERRAAKQLAEKARKEAIRKEAAARRLENQGESRRSGRALKVCAVLQEDPRDPKSLSYEEAMSGPDADE